MLTIVIPAFNEQEKIGKTLEEAYVLAKEALAGFEIIVVDDGSSDRTFDTAMECAAQLGPEVRVLRQPVNRGVGAAYLLGLAEARYPFITLIPGDNAFRESGIAGVFRLVGSTEMVVSYRANMEARTPLRRQLSRIATLLVRLASGKQIRDAHSMYVFPVAEARRITVSAGYSYHLETLVRLLRRVDSYVETPVELNQKPDASSGVMKPRTIWALGVAMLKLLVLRMLGRL